MLRSISAKYRLGLMTLLNVLALSLLSGNVAAQSAEDNLRPVGQVCLAGQSCVGSTAGGSASSSASATTAEAPAAATPAPAAAQAAAEPAAEAFDVAAKYQLSCFACHGTGAAGAPMMGDADVWTERMEKGIDAVMANVINGLNAMPARGLCMDCSDDHLRELVGYMAGL